MRSKRQDGFALLEVVVACAIFAMGIMGIYGLTSWIQRACDFSNKMTTATAVAQANLESVMGNAFGTVASGSNSDGLFDTVWDVTTLNSDLKSIELTTSWADISGWRHVVVLRSLVSN